MILYAKKKEKIKSEFWKLKNKKRRRVQRQITPVASFRIWQIKQLTNLPLSNFKIWFIFKETLAKTLS